MVLFCHVVDDRRLLLAPAAVDVFFVLSGMVVGRSLLSALTRAQGEPRTRTLGTWLRRRWRRTLPPAWAVAAAAAVLGLTTWEDAALAASMLRGVIGQPDTVMGPYWSLAVEEVAYILVALAALALPAQRLPTLGLVLALTGVPLRVAAATLGASGWDLYAWPVLRLDGIGLGLWLAGQPWGRRAPWSPVLGAALLMVGSTRLTGPDLRPAVAAAGAALVLLPLASMAWRSPTWLRRAADVSFPLYLVHQPVLHALGPGLGVPAAVILAAAIERAMRNNQR